MDSSPFAEQPAAERLGLNFVKPLAVVKFILTCFSLSQRQKLAIVVTIELAFGLLAIVTLIAVHAIAIEHSVVTAATVVEATIIAAEVLVTVWLVIAKRLRLRPSATIEPKVLLPAKLLVVVIIAFHPSRLLARASAQQFAMVLLIESALAKELQALSRLLGHLLSLLQRNQRMVTMWHMLCLYCSIETLGRPDRLVEQPYASIQSLQEAATMQPLLSPRLPLSCFEVEVTVNPKSTNLPQLFAKLQLLTSILRQQLQSYLPKSCRSYKQKIM